MRKGEAIITTLIVGAIVSGLLGLGFRAVHNQRNQINQLRDLLSEQSSIIENINLGAFNPAGGLTYRLQISAGTTDTSITLSSFKNRSGIPLTMTLLNTDKGYGTLSPQTDRSEFISFTGVTQNANGTAQLTGVTRGLSDFYPFTASTTLRESHPGQSVFILSDSPQLFEEYGKLRSAQSWTGINTYASTAPPVYDASPNSTSNSLQLAHIGYVDGVTSTGCANATTTDALLRTGCVKIATSTMAARTTSSSTIVTVLSAEYSTSTPYSVGVVSAGNLAVITMASSTINPVFFDKTGDYIMTGHFGFNASTTFSASSTFAGGNGATTTFSSQVNFAAGSTSTFPLVFNDAKYSFPQLKPNTQTFATGTVLTNDGKNGLYWGNANPLVSSSIPMPALGATSTLQAAATGNTTMACEVFVQANRESIGEINIRSGATAGVAGTLKIAFFSDDGQNKHLEVTSGTISASVTTYNIAVSPAVVLDQGNYYQCYLPVGTANLSLIFHQDGAGSVFNSISGEPVYGGTVTVTADTIPSTITPSSLTPSVNNLLYMRFDD